MDINLIILALLIILAAIDLTVGVANDAVNFLNSAIGSRAAKFRTIMIIAAFGVLVGVTFSSGMMEVARKGIFYPEHFIMPELMIIFVAVMFQDILLLDLFNTFGFPTSTTVSIVFGLLGSALAMSAIKVMNQSGEFYQIFEYINTGSVFTIISAILLSIVIAFIAGSFVQYITRLLFTFNYSKTFKRYGSIWSGFALTFLSFFIILKGAKGASFISEDTAIWIKSNLDLLFIYLLVGWTVIIQLLMSFTKINILKIIVLMGTFALAMAFAANDLVNFIGAPLAGLSAYNHAMATENPLTATMEILSQPVRANTWILLAAGAIMVATLFISRKARSVVHTTISLSRQEEGYERFESNAPARAVVRMVVIVFDFISKITPEPIRKRVSGRFDLKKYNPELDKDGRPPAFDLLRAAVILMVAAALISVATFFKLPLSTTYVTFIVAMAAALPDKAWGRESAVYRVSGVINVVGGWFFTAISASLVAFTIAMIIYYAEIFGLIGLAGLSAFVLYRTTQVHKKREERLRLEDVKEKVGEPGDVVVNSVFNNVVTFIKTSTEIHRESVIALNKDDLANLKKAKKKAKKLSQGVNKIIGDVLKLSKHAPDEELEMGHMYTRALASIHEISDKLRSFTTDNHKYIDNNHHSMMEIQVEELSEALRMTQNIAIKMTNILEAKNFELMAELEEELESVKAKLYKFNKNQLKRIKKSASNIRRSMLYLNILNATEVLLENSLRVMETCREAYKAVNNHSKKD